VTHVLDTDAEETAVAVAPPVAAPTSETTLATAPASAVPVRVGRFDYRWVALAVVLGGSIMTILDATVVNVAISTLQADFAVRSYSDIAWVVTAYTLAQGAVIPMTGWVTDRYGTKRVYLITLVLFTAASAACGAAQNLPMLIGFRILQGIGGGMLMPIGLTIILRTWGPAQMGRVMGIFGVPTLLAPAMGPVLGGWFVQDFTWRLIFFINVPIGVVSVIAAQRWLRETPYERKLRLDVLGLFTAVPAVCALMYGVDRSTDLGWGAPLVVFMLSASALLFIVFVRRQLTADEPLLHIRLFKDATFSWSVVLSFVMVTALFGVMYLLPLYFQQVRGYGALATGLLLMPQAVTAAVLMPVSGSLADRFGPRYVVGFGLLVLFVSSIMLAQIHPDTSVAFIVLIMSLRGVAMGFAMMPGMAAGLARIPRESSSRASSITNTVQRAGSSVAIAVLVTILASQTGTAARQASCDPSPAVLAAAARAQMPADRDGFCSLLAERASNFSRDQATAPPPPSDPALASFVKNYRNEAASISFDRVYVFIGIVALLGLIPAWYLRRPERATTDGAPAAA
jgi:EmrB/QacA subfamily drug resistance transporter